MTENAQTLEQDTWKPTEVQQAAIDHIDGPLLVVAGPGTGKTQLLSYRAANILKNRDIRPENILCLTYTEAGAEAMRKRLIKLVGKDGYGIEVCTFHGFTQLMRARYPERFLRNVTARPASPLQQVEILDTLIKGLPFDSLLAGTGSGVSNNLKAVQSFISKMKRAGLSADEFKAIMDQGLQTIEYLKTTPILGLAALDAARTTEKLQVQIDEFRAAVGDAYYSAPAELKTPVISSPGVYTPFITWFTNTVMEGAVVDEAGKSSEFSKLRKRLFGGTKATGKNFKDELLFQRGLVAADLYASYQDRMVAQDLYDFDDMIMDCILALTEDEEFKYMLQEQYRYIQVDEFQDTNGAQMRIVDLLCEGQEQPNVMAVGDDDQAIMRFQGASIACINQFESRYQPRKLVLDTNFRSTPSLVEMGQGIAKQVENRLNLGGISKNIHAFKTEEKPMEYSEKVWATQEEELFGLALEIREQLDSGFLETCDDPDDAIAVIACKHASLRNLIPFLKSLDIPFSYKVKSDLFSLDVMQTLFALIRFAVSYSQGNRALAASCLPCIISSPELGGDSRSSVTFALEAHDKHHGDWLLALENSDDPRISELYGSLVEFAGQASSSPVRQLIYDMARSSLGYYQERAEENPLLLTEFNSGIKALFDFVEGELDSTRELGRSLRLSDVQEKLDAARKYGISVEASVALGAPGAVRLTTAHGSKGLEFDQVYVLDAEDGVWRSKGGGGTNLFASNLLIGEEKDEDDIRRLLFVAVTRAKRLLSFYRAGGETLQELQGELGIEECQSTQENYARALEISWRDDLALDTEELKKLVLPSLKGMSLSVSALNKFVTYEEGSDSGLAFLNSRVLRFPEEPKIQTDFGNLVHEMLENLVVRGGLQDEDVSQEVIQEYRKRVSWMDHPELEVDAYLQRFDRIARTFIPWMAENIAGEPMTEASLKALAGDNVPLYGRLDLLLVDHEAKTIQVVDYKTGLKYAEGKPTPDYARQLCFYRLLVEGSPQFEGYSLVGSGDWYVEPEKDGPEVVHPPVMLKAEDEEVSHLVKLINAVWHRIQAGSLETSGFEDSALKEQALANSNKINKRKMLQEAFETWLIQEDQ